MSGTDAIMEASNALGRLIATGSAADNAAPPADVNLGSPVSEDGGDARFSLWLYRVIENEFQKNVPPTRPASPPDQALRNPPLVLDLYYLLTPFGGSEVRRQQRLGEAMQRLHAAPIVTLAPGPVGPDAVREDLHIQLFRMGLEELTRIWEALNQPLRLSAVYQVRFVRLDLTTETQVRPVSDRRIAPPVPEAAS